MNNKDKDSQQSQQIQSASNNNLTQNAVIVN